MNKPYLKEALSVLLLVSVIFMQSTNAFAQPGPGGPHEGRPGIAHRGPEDIMVGSVHYRYHDGRFYRPVFFGLFEILINVPPAGAIVTVLPPGYKTIVVGGVTYYYRDNVYFMTHPSGYVVVAEPLITSSVTVASPVVTETRKISGEPVTINIPNANGSYTPVTLLKQKDGYVGPQGEYYPGHPTVDQLRVLYGK
jgi:hypothetical protein